MGTKQNTNVEQHMTGVNKSDCISVIKIITETGLSRNTLNAYMNALNIAKLKFPFDSKVYISLDDYQRLKTFIEENQEER
jgi:hypothetical protein